jgi:hypothetical protein
MADRTETFMKSQAKVGMIAWLRLNADTVDSLAFKASDLDLGALDRPVLIVDILTPDHPYIWVCLVRSCSLTLQQV